MKNHLLEKLHPNLTGGTPLNIFKILKNLTEKSYGAFKIQSGKKSKNFKLTSGAPFARCTTSNRKKYSFNFFWKNVVKSGQTNYSRILVLLNNYFSFFEFWSNLVKLWSNCGQTMVKLIIQEILVLLNNNCFLKLQFQTQTVKCVTSCSSKIHEG